MRLDGLTQNLSDWLKAVVPLPVRRSLVRIRHRVRTWTSRYRLLPDFLIIGCQRGGTSSLYKYLGRHPEIAPALRKETEYFTINHHLGELWYRAHFPLALRQRLALARGKRLLTFEATPDYLVDPRAPERCRRMLPEAKIVVMLREPGERALSQFEHNRRLGLETETFETALALEHERITSDLEEMVSNPDTRATGFRRYSYMTRGRYAEQLERWLSVYPRSQVLVLESEAFFSNPAASLEQILDFIGVRRWAPPEFRNYSYLEPVVPHHEQIDGELRSFFDAEFAVPNQALREILDMDIEWLGPGS